MAEQESRSADIALSLEALQERISKAVLRSGRHPNEVTLIAVTKFFPLADLQILRRLGQQDFGESRDQEASVKIPELRAWARQEAQNLPNSNEPTRVHFVGQVQTKKARSVARYADVVHSLDRSKLVSALDTGVAHALESGQRTRPLEALIQVNLDPQAPPDRGGVPPDQIMPLAKEVADSANLRLTGLMAVAPRGAQGADARAAFDRLSALSAELTQVYPQARLISAGMSSDLEEAIQAGATHLRVGGAILGSRYLGR